MFFPQIQPFGANRVFDLQYGLGTRNSKRSRFTTEGLREMYRLLTLPTYVVKSRFTAVSPGN